MEPVHSTEEGQSTPHVLDHFTALLLRAAEKEKEEASPDPAYASPGLAPASPRSSEGLRSEPSGAALREAQAEEGEVNDEKSEENPFELLRARQPGRDAYGRDKTSTRFVITIQLGKERAEADARKEKFDALLDSVPMQSKLSYLVVSHEVAPTTGQHHLQAYFETKKAERFRTLHNLYKNVGLDTVWMQAANGSAEQNRTYCLKDWKDGIYKKELGTPRPPTNQGRRSDISRVQADLEERKPMREIARTHFDEWKKYGRAFREYRSMMVQPRTFPTEVEYVYGPTGSGKTKYAADFYPPSETTYWLAPPKPGQNVWWDGYDSHDVVVIDEYYPGFFGKGHVRFLLRLVDRYPLKVAIHGGMTEFVAKKIIFLSNYHITRIDNKEFSGYDWDEKNPLYSRVYDREPKWKLTPIGEYEDNDPYGPKEPQDGNPPGTSRWLNLQLQDRPVENPTKRHRPQ